MAISRLIGFIGWLLVGLVVVALIIVLLPLLIIVLLIAFIFGLFQKKTVRTWTVRVKQNVQQKASTISEGILGADGVKKNKPGARNSKVIDAQVKDIDEN